ncbi:MAG: carboxypeptidase regulatory-like domain-containing protein [Lewinellaceae bacterium]|nr:carboxypeptidase regulatory-like domain-containing protein [Saprospiraceae bacterium]MCB9345048.1 carboxypeptidase regulatory-like domain-containing protein [Lewinellaceae bacterium]
MVRSLLLTFAVLLCSFGVVLSQSNSYLLGKVIDAEGEVIGASVKVTKGAELIRGAITDFQGEFRISLDPGTYDVEVSYTGAQTQRIEGVQVINGQLNRLPDISLSNNILTEVEIIAYKVPLIEQDKTQGGQTLTSDQIKNLPTRSVNAIVATTAGTSSIDGGDINIKGSRSNATNYYIDGIRVSGTPPPVQDIEQLSVITGGLGAEYGDVTGGVISIVTKGAASDFHGSIEGETSEGLDPYGFRLLTANVSGPILKKKLADGSTRSLIGFRFSGQYNYRKDDNPRALPVYRAKGSGEYDPNYDPNDPNSFKGNFEGPLGYAIEHPLSVVNGNIVSTAQTFTNDSVDVLKANPYQNRTDIDVTGKLDFRLTENIDFSVTGTFRDTRNLVDPGTGLALWRLLNSQNNPTQFGQRYRGLARLRHRLGSTDAESDNSKKVSISNASYQLQFGFERGTSHIGDKKHGTNIMDYGYIGRFDFEYQPFAGPDVDGTIRHIDNFEAFQGYTPGTQNPGIAAYNEFANAEAYGSYLAINGFFSDTYDDIWSGMYPNVNLIYNRYNKTESDIMTITASASFDLKLGKSGVHNFQFGLLNEQRTERSWSIAPRRLWLLADQTANIHFNGLDTSRVIGKFWDPFWSDVIGDSLDQYANAIIDLPDKKFYKELRESLGIGIDEWVNVNSLTPDQLRLDMFGARELNDEGLIAYYGYDYLGNKLQSGVGFADYFKSTDASGVRDFPVAPLQPIYTAAYLKDKFTFNKMIFSLGMRVERFDLNTKVMRDIYSLYQIKDAKSAYAELPLGTRPANVGDDFKVYISGPNSTEVKAFRDGDTWYFADGTQANDGNVIFGGGVVTPLLADTVKGDNILDSRFDPDLSFEDYTPQVNWLPRLAFSFPISDDANFFAHYDVLVQRPPSNWQVTPLNYTYFYTPNRTPGNNANLLPERVVDYEVGFQQKLNQNSAIKFSAYYREQRDMIQSRLIQYVPVIGRYETYGNIDFGTVKGFTWQYDLRRTMNTELRIAYTLQFAGATGSGADSQRGLTRLGNLRTLFPLDFDERHNISAIIDYRYDEGKRYNGPTIGNKDILSNFGINLQIAAASGRPYTATLRPERFGGSGTLGSINGNRLPWRFNADLRVDKTFNLVKGEGKKPLSLNIYFRVSNLLNAKNIIGVYTATGSPIDDGYLATAEGQTSIDQVANQGGNVQAYLDAYSWSVRNPGNYTLPRRLFVGAAFQF